MDGGRAQGDPIKGGGTGWVQNLSRGHRFQSAPSQNTERRLTAKLNRGYQSSHTSQTHWPLSITGVHIRCSLGRALFLNFDSTSHMH